MSVLASNNCALTRTRPPARCTLPSSTCATPSCWAISRRLRVAAFLYWITLVRLITFRSATLARFVRTSSCTPSAKYAFSFSALKCSKGRTAILFSGIGAATLLAVAPGGADVIFGNVARWKRNDELITRAIIDASKTAVSTYLVQLRAPTGRTATASCLHLRRRLSFSGICGLPRPSLWRLNTCKRRPCFTSHSPRSCKYGRQWRYSDRLLAICRDHRMCPASPQSITRWAILIPDPAMLVLSLTSLTRLTGPLCTPIRNRVLG